MLISSVFGVAILYFLKPFHFLRRYRGLSLHTMANKNNSNGEKDSLYFKAYNIYSLSKGEDKANELIKIIRERASRGLASYMILNFISRDTQNSIVVLVSDNSLSINMENEVFITMVSSLGLARLEEAKIDQNVMNRVFNLFKNVKGNGNALLTMTFPNSIYKRKSKNYDLVIGETLDTPTPINVGLQLTDISSHIAIFGSTGTGKSTTASILACKIWKELGIPVLILDWAGEYDILFQKIGCKTKITYFNPLVKGPNIDPFKIGTNDPDLVSEILGKALGLSWPQIYMLSSILVENFPSDLEVLVNVIEAYSEGSKWDREVKKGLLRRIGILTRGQGLKVLRGSVNSSIEIGWRGISVFDLSNIRLSLLRRAYSLLLLSAFYTIRLNKKKLVSDPIFMLIDEAHNIFDPGDIPFTDNLVAESRKLGLWLGIVTQSPSSISNSILLNTNTKIIHSIRSSRDKMIIIDTLNLKRQYMELMDKLSLGEALLATPSLGEPILIRIKLT